MLSSKKKLRIAWLSSTRKKRKEEIAYRTIIRNSRKLYVQDDYKKFKEVVPDDVLIYMQSEVELYNFLTEKIGKVFTEGKPTDAPRKFGVYASPEDGIQVLTLDIDCIKDEKKKEPKRPLWDSSSLSIAAPVS